MQKDWRRKDEYWQGYWQGQKNMKSKSNVHAYVQSLKKRGFIDDIPYSKRSIVVL